MGYKCNLQCTHCHVDASPGRTEEMPRAAIKASLDILKSNRLITTVILTGGAPELNIHFLEAVELFTDAGAAVIVCSNLVIYTEAGMQDIPEILAKRNVKIITSLPGLTRHDNDKQRGRGTYERITGVIRKLNGLGYGREDTHLKIDIIFNPCDASIAPGPEMLERTYKKHLKEMHGISFNQLITFSNMPIGRLGRSMTDAQLNNYIDHLENNFNPEAVEHLMCRHQINIAPDGNLYDCGFMQSLRQPVKSDCSSVYRFDYGELNRREIATHSLCLLCTATSGTTCRSCLK